VRHAQPRGRRRLRPGRRQGERSSVPAPGDRSVRAVARFFGPTSLGHPTAGVSFGVPPGLTVGVPPGLTDRNPQTRATQVFQIPLRSVAVPDTMALAFLVSPGPWLSTAPGQKGAQWVCYWVGQHRGVGKTVPAEGLPSAGFQWLCPSTATRHTRHKSTPPCPTKTLATGKHEAAGPSGGGALLLRRLLRPDAVGYAVFARPLPRALVCRAKPCNHAASNRSCSLCGESAKPTQQSLSQMSGAAHQLHTLPLNFCHSHLWLQSRPRLGHGEAACRAARRLGRDFQRLPRPFRPPGHHHQAEFMGLGLRDWVLSGKTVVGLHTL
jgi:hypothetical protein